MEITNIENEIYTLRWNQSNFMNTCRICLKTMPLEKVSIFDEMKLDYASCASNQSDIDKPHRLRVLEVMLLCCNSISVIIEPIQFFIECGILRSSSLCLYSVSKRSQ